MRITNSLVSKMFLNKPESKASLQCLDKFHHDLLLNFSEESLFEGTDRTFNDVHIEFPYPILEPKANIKPNKEDTVTSLLEKKKEYLDMLERKRKRYKTDARKISKEKIANNEFIYLPRHLVEFYQKNDPDKHFNSDYNYYFTGGTLGVLQIEENSYLVYPDGNNEIHLLNVQNPENILNTGFKSDSPIHSIYTVNKGNEQLFLAREKWCVHLLTLDNDHKAVVKKRNEYKSPVLDAKLNESNLSHQGVLWFNGNLTISNTETNASVFHYKTVTDPGQEQYDHFQQFDFYNNNLICLMDRYKMRIIDFRARTLENTFDPEVIKCNTLCNFKIIDNTVLLASRHYIMKTDLRYLKTVSTYSHTLDVAPCYMEVATDDTDFYLAVAGQRQDSKVLFTGSAPYSLPYEIPSLAKTLDKTMLNDPTLILHLKDFSKRLEYSIAGLKVLNIDGKISIFTSNCLGEIFKQCVSDEAHDNKHSLETLSKWLKLVDIPDPTLHLTFVEEMSDARFALNTEPVTANLKRYQCESKADEFLAKFEPRYRKKNVTSAWAQQFLSVWEDSDETDEEESIDNLPEVPVVDKVEGWIQEHEFANDVNSSFHDSQL